ncbi:MAG: TOBE domain-containing protein, partial [Candidatus Bathyarchaeia archaeon]
KDLELTAIHVTHDQSEAMAISDRIAVMKKGKVLQVGTPQELYMNPQSIFVANFIGGSNFLEGFIAETRGRMAVIELRGGIKVQAVNKGMNKGERVVLAVRPETFTIKRGKGADENSMFGVVERFAFEGTNVRYEVRLENQDLVVVVAPSMACEWFNIGEKVTLSFQPESAHLFAYPELGLREELAVE